MLNRDNNGSDNNSISNGIDYQDNNFKMSTLTQQYQQQAQQQQAHQQQHSQQQYTQQHQYQQQQGVPIMNGLPPLSHVMPVKQEQPDYQQQLYAATSANATASSPRSQYAAANAAAVAYYPTFDQNQYNQLAMMGYHQHPQAAAQQQQQQQFNASHQLPSNVSGNASLQPSASNASGSFALPESSHLFEKCTCRSDNNHIPRPRNAFILFRQKNHQALLDEGNVIRTNPDVSRELGRRWRNLSPQEKEYWNRCAEEEKRKHAEKYPGYKYTPRRNAKKNCPSCKAKAALRNHSLNVQSFLAQYPNSTSMQPSSSTSSVIGPPTSTTITTATANPTTTNAQQLQYSSQFYPNSQQLFNDSAAAAYFVDQYAPQQQPQQQQAHIMTSPVMNQAIASQSGKNGYYSSSSDNNSLSRRTSPPTASSSTSLPPHTQLPSINNLSLPPPFTRDSAK